MGRKPKCTIEEKISAVEDYLNGIRSVSEIMVDLSIKSSCNAQKWISLYNANRELRDYDSKREVYGRSREERQR